MNHKRHKNAANGRRYERKQTRRKLRALERQVLAGAEHPHLPGLIAHGPPGRIRQEAAAVAPEASAKSGRKKKPRTPKERCPENGRHEWYFEDYEREEEHRMYPEGYLREHARLVNVKDEAYSRHDLAALEGIRQKLLALNRTAKSKPYTVSGRKKTCIHCFKEKILTEHDSRFEDGHPRWVSSYFPTYNTLFVKPEYRQ